MKLKGVSKFKGKLTCGLKNDIRNLVNFYVSSWKSKNWHFDWIRRWKSTEKLCLMKLMSDAKFEENLTLGSKNDMRNLVNVNLSSGKIWKFAFWWATFAESNAWAKKIQRSCVVKMTYGFKNDINNLVNLHASSWK